MLGRPLAFILITFGFSPLACAQYATGQALSDYIHGNEKFGRKLLFAIRQTEPDTNIVLSPFPLSQAFGALSEGSADGTTLMELSNVFEWHDQPFRDLASRMLSARIPREQTPTAEPHRKPMAKKPTDEKPPPPSALGMPEPFQPLSQSTVFIYTGEVGLSPRFRDKASNDYGIVFQKAKPGEPLVPSDPDALELYRRNPSLAFSITTFTDLRTAWLHNLFARRTQKLPFTLRSGAMVEADQMVTSIQFFRHIKTEEFEAVALLCGDAYLLVVLPAAGRDLLELEKQIATEEFKLETMLKNERGDVTLPIFRIHFTKDLQPPLECLGLKRVFSNPSSLSAMVSNLEGAFLTATQQRVDLDIDEWGIKAKAVTFMGGVLGGVMGGSTRPVEEPFHMIVNRPFLFFIRDNATDVLLFLGAEVNPATP